MSGNFLLYYEIDFNHFNRSLTMDIEGYLARYEGNILAQTLYQHLLISYSWFGEHRHPDDEECDVRL